MRRRLTDAQQRDLAKIAGVYPHAYLLAGDASYISPTVLRGLIARDLVEDLGVLRTRRCDLRAVRATLEGWSVASRRAELLAEVEALCPGVLDS